MRILVVDDERDLCDILRYNLEAEGYEVDVATSAEEALLLNIASYSLILLDVMMGAMSGFQLLSALRGREETASVPVIFLTALGSEEDTVKGLNLGADDYLPKPVSMRELKARVKAVLRRTGSAETLSFGTVILTPEGKKCTIDGQPLPLTKIEFELLSLLVSHVGKLFDRESLLRHCWPSGTIVSDRTVDVHLARLRKKLGRYGKHIKARHGYGYTFEA